VKLLDVLELTGENSVIVTAAITDTLGPDNFSVLQKVVAFSADNTNANFDGAERRGTNNVYAKLKACLGRNELLAISCNAHILHNAMQTGAS